MRWLFTSVIAYEPSRGGGIEFRSSEAQVRVPVSSAQRSLNTGPELPANSTMRWRAASYAAEWKSRAVGASAPVTWVQVGLVSSEST